MKSKSKKPFHVTHCVVLHGKPSKQHLRVVPLRYYEQTWGKILGASIVHEGTEQDCCDFVRV